ncbi:hypothetical protein DWV16_06225 [Anaerotruncus sp. AF02-27]|jgi:tripartite ATP-independent transporter DctP family solute receptor|uniref:DctP family TRAP transporter solute-binding subunit n=1 Tax=Anaerotruncus TaxID=244127 RepID=UPI000E4B93CD|nr:MULTISPECIES: DctP family TRAP transporter solute-binding subunit [Anaerotruncus]RGX55941.1 hypothetical protein DWV16_06225 [Anaerotruncus sp. AF02-27]
MKNLVALSISVAILLSLAACGGNTASPSAPASSGTVSSAKSAEAAGSENDEVYVFNFGTNQPATHIVAEAYQGLVDELNEQGGGRIKATAYFSEQLGNEKEMVDMVANGINDMVVAPGHSALSTYYPSLQIFDAPYVFDTPEQMLNFANGDGLDPMWDDMASTTKIRVLGTYYFGSRHLTCNDIDVKTPADLKGMKLRVIDAPISLATGRALGADPTPLAYSELYLALSQKIVDAQENPLANILSAKFYEVQNELVLTGHVLAPVAFVINEEKWQSLPDDIKAIVQTAVDHAVAKGSQLIEEAEKSQISELEGYGMKVLHPDVEAFKANAKSVIDEFSSNWNEGLYESAIATPKE